MDLTNPNKILLFRAYVDHLWESIPTGRKLSDMGFPLGDIFVEVGVC